jgi:L-malate glycosyltransferase
VRVLQLFSDWKWTGPAEPMLQLARALRDRGHRVELVCSEAPADTEDFVARRARAAGVKPLFEMPHARGAGWWRDTALAARLRAALEELDVDVVHTWHTRDHVLALRACARRRRAARTRVVRSWIGAEPVPPRPWNRWLFGPGTDGLLCVSPGLAAANAGLRGGRPLRGVFGAVELERFRPGPPEPGVREALGLEPGHRVVGIVARVQRRRRFDLLLEAAARLFKADPAARLLVLGRGTRLREVAEEPAARLGIADRVVLAGYRTGDYAQALRSMDVFTFLVPGSDGGCRALLEACACGLPAVTGPRPPLPEIVSDGETGLVVEERPDALAEAWASLLAEPERRARLGAAARSRALRLFAPERQARLVEDLYREALALET